MTTPKISNLAVGAAGELLVQYHLLKFGIDSARLTTDVGIDLAMFTPSKRIETIQVKTSSGPVPAGGTGALSLGWRFPEGCIADWLACVDLKTDSVWLLTMKQVRKEAQQQNPGKPQQLYWYVDPAHTPQGAKRQDQMSGYLIDNVLEKLTASKPPGLGGLK
jgi:hypothetical protein